MKLTISTSALRKESRGIVYVLELDLEDKKIIKVGYTERSRVEDRVCEILVSIWKRYRIFPQCYVKRYKTFDSPAVKEQSLHKLLEEYRYKPKFTFSGSTELFDVPLEHVVDLYDKLSN